MLYKLADRVCMRVLVSLGSFTFHMNNRDFNIIQLNSSQTMLLLETVAILLFCRVVIHEQINRVVALRLYL